MYVDTCHSGKYVHYILRDSYRQDGKIIHRTIANLSNCSSAEIQAIQIVLKLARRGQYMETTVPEGLEEHKTLCTMELRMQGQPRMSVQRFLEKAKVVLSAALRHRGVKVATRKKLPIRRETR